MYGIHTKKPTFHQAWADINLQALKGQPEHISSNAHYFNCLMEIENPHLEDVNMGSIGYTKSKFRNLMTLYWDDQNCKEFIARLHHYKNVDSDGKKYVVATVLDFKKRMNRTGACLQYISVGKSPTRGWIVQVRTRASEIAQRLYADMVFVHIFLRKLCDYMEIDYEDMHVYWSIDAAYQSVIGVNLWMAMCLSEGQIIKLMEQEPKTKWQKTIQSRYRRNFDLKNERKVYNYAIQQRATFNFDRILRDETEQVDMEELYEMLPSFQLDDEVYQDLFGKKGGGR